MMGLYSDSKMWQLAGGDIGAVNAKTPFDAALLGDYAATYVVESFITHLACGVSNIINVFQPSVVCVGGGISGQGEELMRPLRERLKYTSFGTKDMRTRVEAAVYRNDAGIIGAGLLGIMEE